MPETISTPVAESTSQKTPDGSPPTAPGSVAEPMPESQMLTSWKTTKPELNAGRMMKMFVRLNVYLYTRPPSKPRAAINKFFIKVNIFLYRTSNGRVMGRFGDLDALLITTTGRKTGLDRTTPVGYLFDRGRFIVVAVPGHFDIPNGPRATDPAWFLNLKAKPDASIHIGPEEIDVTARVLPSGGEREAMWARFTEAYPFIGEFAKRGGSVLPVLELTPKDMVS